MTVAYDKSPKHGSTATTHGYSVRVTPRFLKSESAPGENKYTFRYDVTIRNEGGQPAQLVARRWIISDANGDSDVVEGEGVVGLQPMFVPGQAFEYQSYCPLTTPWGTMEGAFVMQDNSGERFEIAIARFYLVCPEPTSG